MRSTGSWYDLRAADGHLWRARLKGKFKLEGRKVTNPIAVGDRVVWQEEDRTENSAMITDILPRYNYIERQSVHKTAHAHVLAANVDQAVLIVTLTFPRTSMGFIDRFLVVAESFRIPTVIVFNKQDIIPDEFKEVQDQVIEMYQSLGYQCLKTSATEGEGSQVFADLLTGKVSVLAGHSGVGKSSLVNAVAPDLLLRTNEVSTFANKGVHTTTFAEMFELNATTFIIDSPGIKELGLTDIGQAEIGHCFPEFRALLNECRFHNCQHINEPGCAVKTSVEAGAIGMSRYESYLSMMGGQDNRK